MALRNNSGESLMCTGLIKTVHGRGYRLTCQSDGEAESMKQHSLPGAGDHNLWRYRRHSCGFL